MPSSKICRPYIKLIKQGEFDATDIITHKLKLDEGKHAYEIFDKKLEDCIKVILKHRNYIRLIYNSLY